MNYNWKIIFEDLEPFMADRGMSPTDFAREIDMSPSTLLRPLNDPEFEGGPTLRTVQAIYAYMRKPIPEAIFRVLRPGRDVAKPRPPASPARGPKVRRRDDGLHHVITIEIRVPKGP